MEFVSHQLDKGHVNGSLSFRLTCI